jgi:hypothetical protein
MIGTNNTGFEGDGKTRTRVVTRHLAGIQLRENPKKTLRGIFRAEHFWVRSHTLWVRSHAPADAGVNIANGGAGWRRGMTARTGLAALHPFVPL